MVKSALRISFFKEAQWPPAAPRPRALLDRTHVLVDRVNRALAGQGSLRVITHVTIHANRRLGVAIKADADARYSLRMHWALLQITEFDQALQHAVAHGNFPPFIEDAFHQLRPQITHEHVYDDLPNVETGGAGTHFQLEDILTSVAQFLPEGLSHEGVRIVWGKQSATPNKRTIRLGSMDTRKAVIRIHPVLDSVHTPRHVMEFIIWHELCHYVAPPLTADTGADETRRRIHHDGFRALEQLYPHYEDAERWIRTNIRALLQGDLSRAKN